MARHQNPNQKIEKEALDKRDQNNFFVLCALIAITINTLFWAFPFWEYVAVGFGKLFGNVAGWKTFWYFLSFVIGASGLGIGYWGNRQQK